MMMEENFVKKFLEEAHELLRDLEEALLRYEAGIEKSDAISEIFRIMHTLKGGSAMFGYNFISDLTHHLESIYEFIRKYNQEISQELSNFTFELIDLVTALLEDKDLTNEELRNNYFSMLNRVKALAKFYSSNDSNNGIHNENSNYDGFANGNSKLSVKTYYIQFRPDENILKNGTNPLYLIDELHTLGKCIAIPNTDNIPFFEDLDPLKCYVWWDVFLATAQSTDDINDVFIFVMDESEIVIEEVAPLNILENEDVVAEILEKKALYRWQYQNGITSSNALKESEVLVESINKTEDEKCKTSVNILHSQKNNTITSIRVSTEKLDQMMNLVSEMVTTQARLSLLSEHLQIPELMLVAEGMQKLTRQLRDNAFSICLIPIQNIVVRFQRLVRDLSFELKKDIQFDAEGTETELDKTIIESLTDPIMHILRNSIDHGIESKEERLRKGKPAVGRILFKAFYSGANVHIQISDDGKGIDTEAVRRKAIENGLITEDTQLSKKEIYDLIFLPGFSTAKEVSGVSGRGVGMDVVKRKITDIRGEVEVDSEKDKGTTITIKLPLTLSIIDGLLIKIGDTHFIIPLSVISQIYGITIKQLHNARNGYLILDGETVPYLYLRREFEISYDETSEEENIQVIVISYMNSKVGLVCDKVVGEYQAVLKPLGKLFRQQDEISGASILGDGTIALVFDTNKLIKKYLYKN